MVQDDPVDEQSQVCKKASIYNSVFLTTVTASGENSDAGLPGRRPNACSFEQQKVVELPSSNDGEGVSHMTTASYYSPCCWRKNYTGGPIDYPDSSRPVD